MPPLRRNREDLIMAKKNSNPPAAPKPPCKGCGGTGSVRVSRGRFPSGNHTRQQYDIVTEPCPDCAKTK